MSSHKPQSARDSRHTSSSTNSGMPASTSSRSRAHAARENVERSVMTPQQISPTSRRPSGAKSSAASGAYTTSKRLSAAHSSRPNAEPTTAIKTKVSGNRLDDMARLEKASKLPPRSGSSLSHQATKKDIWTPEASLRPSSTAPLSSRLAPPSTASAANSFKRPIPLDQMPLDVQEASILEDLLFVLMGYEGQYIQFRDDYNPSNETDRLAGPQFKISHGLDPSLRDLLISLLKMATCYHSVDAFVEVQSREEFGAVNHALCATIRNMLKDYLQLITQLEHQFLSNPSFTLNTLYIHTLSTARTMSHLYKLALEILRKNSMLEDDLEDSIDDFDDVENILESLREGVDIGAAAVSGRKVCKGGNVLRLLTRRLESIAGDPAARNLHKMLLKEASRPYMTMLNEWLHHGTIKDPHSEFLVREQKSIKRERLEEDYTDEYWEKRYTLRDNEIPPQLEGVKDKVLLAGKYLNVVRECGGVDIGKEVEEAPSTFEDSRFLDNVNSAYAYANESLLNLLLTTHGLKARLRSLKHYFFLDRSDFFSYFLELSSQELKKPAKAVNVPKLQSLLDLALRQPGSIAANDPFKEDVRVQMNEVGLTKWLMRVVSVSGLEEGGTLEEHQRGSALSESEKQITGFNAMELDYSVPFPLSLVISRKTVLRYQLLFRYLLSLRHLEILLVGSWQDHCKVPAWRQKSKYPRVQFWKRRAFTLRARMLVFVQQLLYFSTSEVLEPNWNDLQQRIEKVTTVDELMQNHVDFLDTCLKECMLTNSKLLKIHEKLMTTCTMFASYTPHLSKALTSTDPDLATVTMLTSLASSEEALGSEAAAKMDKLAENLRKYEENFGRHLKILLDALNYYAATETVVLLGLCARLATASEGGETDEANNTVP